MIRQKSSLCQGQSMQSELLQPSEPRRDPEKDLSSVGESATRVGTGVRTESGIAASVRADDDPAANLFPVRTGLSGGSGMFVKRAPRRAATRRPVTNVPEVSWAAPVKRRV